MNADLSPMRYSTSWVLGIGLRARCPPADLIDLITRLTADYGLATTDLTGVATWQARLETPAVRALAASLNGSIVGLERPELARVGQRVLTRSPRVRALIGIDSVAEAAALVLADRLADGPTGALAGPRWQTDVATAALATCATDAAIDNVNYPLD
tara:strand:+ start:455 stop:922 length:468 start_codon:yes stop_codon:yes gene_type:complete